jgi:hypothetical protein
VLRCAELLDRADYLVTLARLAMLDWLYPPEETPVDRAIREEGVRLRRGFPWLDERAQLRAWPEISVASGLPLLPALSQKLAALVAGP